MLEALEIAKIDEVDPKLAKEYFIAASKGFRVGFNKLYEKENQSVR